jgi:hypothetical protein
MHNISYPNKRTYYIALNGDSVQAYGFCDPVNCLTTPSESIELFDNEEDMNSRLTALDVTVSTFGINDNTPLEIRKELIKANINKIRLDQLEVPVSFNGNLYDADDRSTSNLIGIVAAISVGLPLPSDFTWRTSDNKDVPMNAAGILGLAQAILSRKDYCYKRSWALKAQIDASEDPELINLYEGWE